jgi:predicted dehydrogenase
MANEILRVLQIGAGSMGTRRLRDLSPRGDVALGVYDAREDRRQRAQQRFSVEPFADLEAALSWDPQVLVISTPPDEHRHYVELALTRRLHHFCEAHVWTPDFRAIEAAEQEHGLVCASSNSMCFLPVVRKLKQLVAERLGSLHAYQMFLSTWLPSWHPYEQGAFYAWRRPTAAAREMVPFELLYLNDVFGSAVSAAGGVSRRGQLEAASDDTWCLQMNLAGGAHGQLSVLMGSPSLSRHGCCFGSCGGLRFDIVSGQITYQCEDAEPQQIACGAMKEVLENAYAEEINTFMGAVLRRNPWPYTYRASSVATATLAAAETSARSGRWEPVDPLVQPAETPAG